VKGLPGYFGRSDPLIPGSRERHQQRTECSSVQITLGKGPGSLQPTRAAAMPVSRPALAGLRRGMPRGARAVRSGPETRSSSCLRVRRAGVPRSRPAGPMVPGLCPAVHHGVPAAPGTPRSARSLDRGHPDRPQRCPSHPPKDTFCSGRRSRCFRVRWRASARGTTGRTRTTRPAYPPGGLPRPISGRSLAAPSTGGPSESSRAG
jgi:hypothetical protein